MRLPLAATALIMLAAPALAQPMPPAGGTMLNISAEGSSNRVPDIAEVSAGVLTGAATADVAMRDNASKTTAVIAALKRAGIADRDIQTSGLSLSPQYLYQDNQPPKLTGYQANNRLSVTFREVRNAGRIIDTLVGNGVNQINGPNFRIDKPDAALDEARGDAVKQARARAELYARATGLRVKRIVSISEGVEQQPPRPYELAMTARKASMADSTPIEAGEQKLMVSLSVRFELE